MGQDYANILNRLERLKPCRRERTWYARCPAHDDREPSLLLWVGRNGCLCARCLSNHGCDWHAIVKALGTRPSEWFPERENRKMSAASIVATYDYHGEDGQLLYQVVRFSPKRFAQRRPDGQGGWLWYLDGIERVPYRLPELLARPSEPVVIAEGEKDVESMRRLGLLATCNPGGAGKWQIDFGRWLAGRRVAVLPDNDQPGLAHAVLVAGSLLFWGAESIRLVSLPNLPPGGDPSDWLTSLPEGTPTATAKAELCRLIRDTPEWRCALTKGA